MAGLVLTCQAAFPTVWLNLFYFLPLWLLLVFPFCHHLIGYVDMFPVSPLIRLALDNVDMHLQFSCDEDYWVERVLLCCSTTPHILCLGMEQNVTYRNGLTVGFTLLL